MWIQITTPSPPAPNLCHEQIIEFDLKRVTLLWIIGYYVFVCWLTTLIFTSMLWLRSHFYSLILKAYKKVQPVVELHINDIRMCLNRSTTTSTPLVIRLPARFLFTPMCKVQSLLPVQQLNTWSPYPVCCYGNGCRVAVACDVPLETTVFPFLTSKCKTSIT